FGRATITVTDDSNHRFVSVPVSVTVNGVVQTVATDGNGNAKFTQLQPGRYTFTATLVGGLADGSYTVDGPATVVVTAGANQWGTIKLRRLYGNIEIIVRDAAGNLIDKAMNVTVVSGPSRYGWGQTSSWPIYIVNSGIARIKDVPIGAYQFSADMNPLMAQGHCYNNKKSGIVNVTAGATTSSTIIVFRCGQATVTVIDDTKAPVPVATVTIDGVTKTTDANGRATFDLQDGTHSIRASKGGYTGGTPQPVTVTLANSGNTSLAISIGTRQW
ncbi:MAG: carboxypeptidase-like regulatory domain-containing protein, partial [candidate division KSB1 bacterium]|nr:carboxypeptidase-like regulatory domain-containing protein [candidate division KSB1 bacterium]